MDDAKLYNQDCEFYRYQDKLRWNRFQTVALIEAGILAAVLKAKLGQVEGLGHVEVFVFLLFAGVLVFAATVLACRDQRIAELHLNRLRDYEGEKAFSKERSWWTGKGLMLFGSILVNVFNAALLVWVFFWP